MDPDGSRQNKIFKIKIYKIMFLSIKVKKIINNIYKIKKKLK